MKGQFLIRCLLVIAIVILLFLLIWSDKPKIKTFVYEVPIYRQGELPGNPAYPTVSGLY